MRNYSLTAIIKGAGENSLILNYEPYIHSWEGGTSESGDQLRHKFYFVGEGLLDFRPLGESESTQSCKLLFMFQIPRQEENNNDIIKEFATLPSEYCIVNEVEFKNMILAQIFGLIFIYEHKNPNEIIPKLTSLSPKYEFKHLITGGVITQPGLQMELFE